MLKVRAALDALTLAKDGVDGKSIYLYGEAWNFGVMANNGRGVNAIQVNMAGTGIGSFSDRIRDAVRGGGPFSPRRDQGFATGSVRRTQWHLRRIGGGCRRRSCCGSPTSCAWGWPATSRATRSSTRNGATKPGSEVDYFGMPGAYGAQPEDTIQYIGVHDDPDWFDAMNLKLSSTVPRADRVRMHRLGLSIVALSQGVPFFMAGDEILRSKSADRNSYNSGDWFNRIDWTLKSNNWGVGLPPAKGNQDDWSIIGPALADPNLKPTAKDIEGTYRHMLEMLVIRKTSGLFRLRTADEIKKAVSFFNVGPDQVPGLIVERIVNTGEVLLPRLRGGGAGECHAAGADASPMPRSGSSRCCCIPCRRSRRIRWCAPRSSRAAPARSRFRRAPRRCSSNPASADAGDAQAALASRPRNAGR